MKKEKEKVLMSRDKKIKIIAGSVVAGVSFLILLILLSLILTVCKSDFVDVKDKYINPASIKWYFLITIFFLSMLGGILLAIGKFDKPDTGLDEISELLLYSYGEETSYSKDQNDLIVGTTEKKIPFESKYEDSTLFIKYSDFQNGVEGEGKVIFISSEEETSDSSFKVLNLDSIDPNINKNNKNSTNIHIYYKDMEESKVTKVVTKPVFNKISNLFKQYKDKITLELTSNSLNIVIKEFVSISEREESKKNRKSNLLDYVLTFGYIASTLKLKKIVPVVSETVEETVSEISVTEENEVKVIESEEITESESTEKQESSEISD